MEVLFIFLSLLLVLIVYFGMIVLLWHLHKHRWKYSKINRHGDDIY